MSNTVHAFEFLAAPAARKLPHVCAVFGDEPFLTRLVLNTLRRQVMGDDPDVPVATYDCQDRSPDWRDVADELATASLFGGGRPRLVILERADSFVSANRQELEDYVAQPRAASVLVLDVDEWPANTRLYKALDQSGLQIDCRPPQKKGKSKEPDEAAIASRFDRDVVALRHALPQRPNRRRRPSGRTKSRRHQLGSLGSLRCLRYGAG
jgi:DNA polymerase III subunit delta